jgi:hypothetical protein
MCAKPVLSFAGGSGSQDVSRMLYKMLYRKHFTMSCTSCRQPCGNREHGRPQTAACKALAWRHSESGYLCYQVIRGLLSELDLHPQLACACTSLKRRHTSYTVMHHPRLCGGGDAGVNLMFDFSYIAATSGTRDNRRITRVATCGAYTAEPTSCRGTLACC